jgi:hypothetical protein
MFWWKLLVIKHMALSFIFIDEMTKSREPPRGIIQQKRARANAHTSTQERTATVGTPVVSVRHKIMKIHAHHLLPLPAGASIQTALNYDSF